MPLVIFSDFDGTITTQDAFDKIIAEVYSYNTYKKVEQLQLENKITNENYLEFFNGITYDIKPLANDVEPSFQSFYRWIKKQGIEFYIISAGFKTIIQHVLPYIPPELIYSNDIILNEDQTWKVKLYDHLSIRKTEIINLHNSPSKTSIYLGDGISDFKVVGKVDYLFCKKDSLLHKKCIAENHTHITFINFNEVIEKLSTIPRS